MKKYNNYDSISTVSNLSDIYKWQKERKAKVKDLTVHIPQANQKDAQRIQNNRSDFSITWIGHSTFLIQMNGLNIITDPVWAKRMGFAKRLTEPGLTLEEIPEIDIVLISHGHYDHLDFGTIKKLRGKMTFLVPSGLKRAFQLRGYKNIIEANWWDGYQLDQVRFTFVPAQHWTRRTPFDTNTSHWGGWVMESVNNKQTVYFAGDSGYFRGFKDIGLKFHITHTLMPIGAYEPDYMMKLSHINPEDAIEAFQDTKGNKMIPMHYGAYRLADDTGPEALERLLKQWNHLELPQEQLAVLKIGETLWEA